MRALWLLSAVAGAYAAYSGLVPVASPAVAANDLGTAVAAPEPLEAAAQQHLQTQPVGYVENCVWTNPGADPWRGDDLSALLRAGIPEEHARRIAEMIQAKARTGTVAFTRQSVKSDAGTVFSSRFSMTFANSLCRNSRVGFAAGRVEQADLFSSGGYHVAVPYVCGNVTRLYPSVLSAMAGKTPKAPMLAESASPAPVMPEVTPVPPGLDGLPGGPGAPVPVPQHYAAGPGSPFGPADGPFAGKSPSAGLFDLPPMGAVPSVLGTGSVPTTVAAGPVIEAPGVRQSAPTGLPAGPTETPAPGKPTVVQPGTDTPPGGLPGGLQPGPDAPDTPAVVTPAPAPVPAPATLLCLASGLAALVTARRRRPVDRAEG